MNTIQSNCSLYPLRKFIRIALFFSFSVLAAGFAEAQSVTGPTTGYVNVSYTYSYNAGALIVGPSWTATKGTVTSTSVSGTTYSAVVKWTTAGAGNIQLSGSQDGYEGDLNVTVSTCTISAPTSSGGPFARCGTGALTLTAAAGSGGTVIHWYPASTGTSTIPSGTSYSPTLTGGTTAQTYTYYITTYNSTTSCESTPRTAITGTVNPVPVATVANQVVFAPASTNIALSSNVASTTYTFTASASSNVSGASSGTTVPIVQALSQSNLLNGSVTYTITPKTTLCTGTPVTSLVSVYPPAPIFVNKAVPVGGTTYYNSYGRATMLSTYSFYTSYQWYNNNVLVPGATSATLLPPAPGSYKVVVSGPVASPVSTSGSVTIAMPNAQGDSVNMFSQTIFYEAGLSAVSSPYLLKANDLAQTLVYSDGLHRQVQTVGVGMSQSNSDVVIPVGYGKNGYADSSFLPYTTAASEGRFRHNALRGGGALTYAQSEQYLFFQQAPSKKIAVDANPYARTLYRATPDARRVENGSPGAAWQTGSTHTLRNQRSLAVSSDTVRLWNSSGLTTGFYPDNTVWCTTYTDENNHVVKTYTDKRGLLVLKKSQLSTNLWLKTYYIYDNDRHVIYQLPPKAVALLGSSSSQNANNATIASLIYKYSYDSLGRVIQKTAPGTGASSIVYDKLDRVVMTQDASQKAMGLWMFIKYDYKNRPVYFGQLASTASRLTLQTAFNSASTYFETPSSSGILGYSNTVYPTTGLTALGSYYYDNYDFDRNGTADQTYKGSHLAGLPAKAGRATRGLPTGSKKLILGTTNWLSSYIFYDTLDRPLQIQSNNHLNLLMKDTVSVLYFTNNLSDKPFQIKTTHSGTTTVNVVQRYAYDSAWRNTALYHKINTSAEQQLVAYEYNDLGQLVTKKLHVTGGVALQNVDMRYNIRGWISSINNAALSSDAGATNNDTNDYFGMEFLYNSVDAGLSNTAVYNGNISAVKWKGTGAGTGTLNQRSYSHTYDNTDRLTSAVFKANSGGAGAGVWNKESNTLNETMGYDVNGNILKLLRSKNQRGFSQTGSNPAAWITSTVQSMDSLTYQYSSGNQLSRVNDSGGTDGFKNGANTTGEYSYDTRGNLIADKNKLIDSIRYNILGKPLRVIFHNGNRVSYVYDAAGTKQSMKSVHGDTTDITDYVGGFVYTNSVLSFFSSPEGRVVKNASGYEYQYAITDHLGNTRVIFTSQAQTAQTITATFEAASSDFQNYPSGANISGTNAHLGTHSEYLNGTQNNQVGVAHAYAVFPGDSLNITAWIKYSAPTTTNGNVAGFAGALLGAFGLTTPGVGETGTRAAGINTWGGVEAGGFSDGSTDNTDVKAMVTIVLFDKNYNFIDVAYAQAGSGSSGAFAQVTASYKVREAGYAFLYISNENPMMADAYFDDVQMSYVPSRILQYNEYYPFGLQTASSWTRDGAAANSYLANGGSEINSATKLYDLDFRNYDPALGRLHQIDLMADKYSSVTPYNFTFNNPGNLTDKSGLDPSRYMFTFMDDDVQNSRQGGLFWRSNDQAWPTAPAPNQGAKQQPGQTNADFLYELADEAGDGIHVYTNDGTGYFRYNEAASNQAMNSYGLASFKWYDKPDANGISAEGVYRLGGQAPGFERPELKSMEEVAADINNAFYPTGRFLSYINDSAYGPNFFLNSVRAYKTANSENRIIPSGLRFGLKTAAWGHHYFEDPSDEVRHTIGGFLAAAELGPATAWDLTSANEYYGFIMHDLWPILTRQERKNWAMEDEDFTNNYIGIQLFIVYDQKNKK